LRLRKQEQLVGCVTLGKLDDNLLLVSQLGYAKRMPVSKLRRANRGDIGTQALYFTTKSDALAGGTGSSGGWCGACDEYPAWCVYQ